MIKFDLLPERLRGGVRDYIEEGNPPGGFLTAVIQNDLMGSLRRADGSSRKHLFDIGFFFYNEAPGNCWGTPEIMAAWIEQGGMKHYAQGS
tara:strand:- start:3001 stop:3273 length:273 start_codon:yes stop_codon:yes gene_type:complete